MSTPESKVKRKITAELKSLGVWYYMPIQRGLGRAGVPDYLCVYRGFPFSIEAKAGNNKPSTAQDVEMKTMRRHGITTMVVNETNIHHIKLLVQSVNELTASAESVSGGNIRPDGMGEAAQ